MIKIGQYRLAVLSEWPMIPFDDRYYAATHWLYRFYLECGICVRVERHEPVNVGGFNKKKLCIDTRGNTPHITLNIENKTKYRRF